MAFFQSIICPSTSPELLSASSTVASSPFTIGFVLAGWKSAGQFVNTIILICFISAANGVVYIQSRTLYSLALTKKAPKFFAATTSRGGEYLALHFKHTSSTWHLLTSFKVPYRAILFSNLWGFLSLMSIKTSSGAVFTYITDFGGTAAYIAWASITLVQLRVRAAARVQGIDRKQFPFAAPGGSWVYWLNFAFNIFLLLIQGFTSFERPFNYKTFIACYISIPLFFVMFFGYKWWFRTRWLVKKLTLSIIPYIC